MLNKLDNKLILDRQFALELLDCLDVNDPDHGQVAKKLHEIMSVQDNTGWVAAPVVPKDDQFYGAFTDTNDLECWGVARWGEARACYTAMLEASPPLLGGGE